MTGEYIGVKMAAELTGENERTIYRRIEKGDYQSETIDGAGRGGKNFVIALSSLPAPAQLKYLEMKVDEVERDAEANEIDFDMAAYKEKFGEKGLKKFLSRYEIVQKALDIESMAGRNKTELWDKLAKENDMSKRTLDRLVNGYKTNGVKALMKKLDRKNKGVRTSTCLKAKDFIMDRYIDKTRRTKQKVFEMLIAYKAEHGADACKDCIYNPDTTARVEFEANVDYEIPICLEMKEGLIATDSSSTISRILSEDVDNEILDYVRRGRKYWEAKYMQKATREKPKLINEVWFGDHHVLDVFVKDKDGKVVKPWLTAWFDAASGCIVGWCLSTNPNSKTIAEALAYGVCEKKEFPFCGLPSIVYTDNGKDYRSHAFEGSNLINRDHGKALSFNIETIGILKQLEIENIHAKAYHGWAKPIERFFGTFADKYVRELPGWCGRHPDERREDFENI